MSAGQTSHTATDLGNSDHRGTYQGKSAHTHIPRIANNANIYNETSNANSFSVVGGGAVECGICGEVLMDSQN